MGENTIWDGAEEEGGWIWGFGLPAHLWGEKTFKAIGGLCGGLVEGGIGECESLEWFKIHVRRLELAPESLWFDDGLWAFRVALWRHRLSLSKSVRRERNDSGLSEGRRDGRRLKGDLNFKFQNRKSWHDWGSRKIGIRREGGRRWFDHLFVG